jgi:hypothetical protein
MLVNGHDEAASHTLRAEELASLASSLIKALSDRTAKAKALAKD